MNVIGFNFTKISAERSLKVERPSITTNIEITNIEKEDVPLLPNQDAAKFSFNYSLVYENQAEKSEEKEQKNKDIKSSNSASLAKIDIDGHIVLTTTKDELSSLQKSWKKKQITPATQVPLYNIILKKCSSKAIQLQDELNLPSHLPLPRVQIKKQDDD